MRVVVGRKNFIEKLEKKKNIENGAFIFRREKERQIYSSRKDNYTLLYLEDVGGRVELVVVAGAHSAKYAIRDAKRRLRRRHVRADLQ